MIILKISVLLYFANLANILKRYWKYILIGLAILIFADTASAQRRGLFGRRRQDPEIVSGSDTASGFEAAPAAGSGAASGPVPGIGRLMRRILSEEPDIMLRKPPHLGCAVLRNAIAQYLLRFRGMQVQPANILIGSGAEYLYGIPWPAEHFHSSGRSSGGTGGQTGTGRRTKAAGRSQRRVRGNGTVSGRIAGSR